MVLQMTRPWKHPDSGIFYFRKRVPEAFKARIKRAVVKVSLNTRDPAEAKRRHTEMALAVAEEWAALMRAPEPPRVASTLSEKQCHALAGELYAEVVAQHQDNPGDPDRWERKLAEIQTCIPFAMREPGAPRNSKVFGENAPRGMVSSIIRPWLAKRQLNLDAQSRGTFAVTAAMALARAYKRLLQVALGDGTDDANRFPAFEAVGQTAGTWEDLYAGYLLECKPAASTQKRQRGILAALFKFLGHDDPARVSKADMIRWKEYCLTLKRARTVRDADIAHPKTLFTWAFDEGKLPLNPAAGVRVRVNDEVETRDREFTYDEARTILSWSLVPAGGRISVDRAAAVRWIPWICLYSGARVNEITQARAQDVFQLEVPEGDPVWVIRITPEAGPVKNKKKRDVPLHPHLIEQGFLDYVRSRKGKCLFYDPGRSRGGKAGNPISKKAGEALRGWVRLTCGVSDPDVSPNHGWRHYFRSACLAVDIQEHIINGIDGHAANTVARKYGSLWPKVAYDNILRLPRVIVKPAIEGEQIVGAPGGRGSRPRTGRGAPLGRAVPA